MSLRPYLGKAALETRLRTSPNGYSVLVEHIFPRLDETKISLAREHLDQFYIELTNIRPAFEDRPDNTRRTPRTVITAAFPENQRENVDDLRRTLEKLYPAIDNVVAFNYRP